jgi:hypothetical protein
MSDNLIKNNIQILFLCQNLQKFFSKKTSGIQYQDGPMSKVNPFFINCLASSLTIVGFFSQNGNLILCLPQ